MKLDAVGFVPAMRARLSRAFLSAIGAAGLLQGTPAAAGGSGAWLGSPEHHWSGQDLIPALIGAIGAWFGVTALRRAVGKSSGRKASGAGNPEAPKRPHP